MSQLDTAFGTNGEVKTNFAAGTNQANSIIVFPQHLTVGGSVSGNLNSPLTRVRRQARSRFRHCG